MAKDILMALGIFVLGWVLWKINWKLREFLDEHEREIYEWFKERDGRE